MAALSNIVSLVRSIEWVRAQLPSADTAAAAAAVFQMDKPALSSL